MARREHKRSLIHDVLRLPRLSRPVRYVLVALPVFVLTPYVLTPLYAFGRPASTVMLWRGLTGQRVERDYAPLSLISPRLQLAVLIAEDGRFCTHHGVYFTQIQNAIDKSDELAGLRGASTITQQFGKNLFLWHGRSYMRKALEFPLALWLDLILSKQRILEIYLNIAEWGPHGEFGVEAGSRYAFGKSARNLNRYQAALLVAVRPIRPNAAPAGRDPACVALPGFMSPAPRAPRKPLFLPADRDSGISS